MLTEHVGRRITSHVSQRLATKQSAVAAHGSPKALDHADTAPEADAAYRGAAQQVPRVKMPDGLTVLVDGSASQLVDLSKLGAQVLSPSALRPNHPVKIQLQKRRGPLGAPDASFGPGLN